MPDGGVTCPYDYALTCILLTAAGTVNAAQEVTALGGPGYNG
jgi:hypothetical protein